MKRIVDKSVRLRWIKTGNCFELLRPSVVFCVARVWGPEKSFDDKEYHLATFHLKHDGKGLRIAQVRGRASSLFGAVRMAEALIYNETWWGKQDITIDRTALEKKKLTRIVCK